MIHLDKRSIGGFSDILPDEEAKLRSLAVNARKLTPGILYGALSTATIFPLVEATRQAIGANNYPLLMALGALASSIGGNLVAEQISRWHEQSEEQLAAELTQKAATDAAWRNTLDDLLERFDALRVVQTVMSEADGQIGCYHNLLWHHDWFGIRSGWCGPASSIVRRVPAGFNPVAAHQ